MSTGFKNRFILKREDVLDVLNKRTDATLTGFWESVLGLSHVKHLKAGRALQGLWQADVACVA